MHPLVAVSQGVRETNESRRGIIWITLCLDGGLLASPSHEADLQGMHTTGQQGTTVGQMSNGKI